MPNGRGAVYETESLTAVGIGDIGAEALRRFADMENSDNSPVLKEEDFVHFWGDGPYTDGPAEAFDSFQIKATPEDIPDRPYVSDPERFHEPARFRAYLDSQENFPEAFEHIESAIRRTVRDESERDDGPPSLHQVLVTGDLSDSLTMGTLPLISAMIDDICDDLDITTHVSGVFSLPISSKDRFADRTSIEMDHPDVSASHLKAYIGLCEISHLLSEFESQRKDTEDSNKTVCIPLHESVSKKESFDITEGVFDFFGLVGWLHDEFGESSPRDSVDTMGYTLGYLSEEYVFTHGYGPIKFPGVGGSWGRDSPTYWLETRHMRSDGSKPVGSDEHPPYSTRSVGTDLPVSIDIDFQSTRNMQSHVYDVTEREDGEDTLYIHADFGPFSVHPHGSIDEISGESPEEIAQERLPPDCISYPELLNLT